MKILTNYNFSQNEIQNAAIQRLATAPTTPPPVKGQLYFNTSAGVNRLFCYNGTSWVGADAEDAVLTGDGIITAINGSALTIDDDNLSANVNSSITNSHTHTNSTVLANTTASFKTAQETKLGFITVSQGVDLDQLETDTATNNSKVSNATHTGDVTGSTALTIADKAVTLGKMNDMSTASFIGRNTPLAGSPEILPAATVKSMLGLALTQTANATGFSIAGGTISKSLTVNNNLTLGGTDNSTLQIGAGGTLGTGAFAAAYVHPSHTGDVTGSGALTITNKAVTLAKMADITTLSIIGRKTALTGVPEVLSKTDVLTLLNVADGANNYVHPNHTGDVTSVADGVTTIGDGKVISSKIAGKAVTLDKMADIATASIIGRKTTATGAPEILSKSDVLTILNVADGAQVNTVASVAGKTGVVALTSTDVGLGSVTNNAQIKKSVSSVNGKIPIWNGTTGDSLGDGYTVETTLTGGAGAIPRADAVKTYIDTFLSASDAMVFKGTLGTGGTITAIPTTYSAGWTYKVITAGTYAGQVCQIGDLILAIVDRAGSGNVNSDWVVIQTNIDGAVTGPASATTGNFPLFDGTTGKLIKNSTYKPSSFATSTHNHDTVYPKKYTTTLGGSTSQVVTHNLNTRDCSVTIRESTTPYAMVMADIEFTDLNTVTIKFAVAPTAAQYTVTIIG